MDRHIEHDEWSLQGPHVDPLRAFIDEYISYLEGERLIEPQTSDFPGLIDDEAELAIASLNETWSAPLGELPAIEFDSIAQFLVTTSPPALTVIESELADGHADTFDTVRLLLADEVVDWEAAVAEVRRLNRPLGDAVARVPIGRLSELAARSAAPDAVLLLRIAADDVDPLSRLSAARSLSYLDWFFEADHPRSSAELRDLQHALQSLARDEDASVRAARDDAVARSGALRMVLSRRPAATAALKARASAFWQPFPERMIEIAGGALILAVFASAFSTNLSLSKAVVLVTLGLLFVALGISPAERESGAPTEENGAPGGASLYSEALGWCLRGNYVLAEEQWKVLARQGHRPSAYSLAVLYAVTNSDEYHKRARSLFEGLVESSNLGCAVRARLALALLDLERREDLTTFEQQLRRVVGDRAAATSRGINRSEEMAVSVGRTLLSLIEKQMNGIEAKAHHRGLGNTWHALTTNVGDPAKARLRTCALSQLLALSLPLELDSSSEALKMLVPVEYRPDEESSRWRRLGLMARADVPVLRPDGPPTDGAYGIRTIDRCARWMLWKGLRGNAVSILALALVGVVAFLIAIGQFLGAGVVLLAAEALDTVDGRIAQIGSQNVRRALYIDYVTDRLGDVGLGLGFFFYFRDGNEVGLSSLSLLFICACLMVSYVRAEADRFGLDAAGGLFERPHRMILLIIGLLISAPAYPLLAATALTTVTAFQRCLRAVLSARERRAVEDNVFRLSVMSVGEDGLRTRQSRGDRHVG